MVEKQQKDDALKKQQKDDTREKQQKDDTLEKQQKDDTLEKLTAVLSRPNLPQDQKDAIGTLKTTYLELSDYLAQASWVERVETIQVEATYIASIAGVAVFLGAVQIGVIAYVATIAPTSKADPNPSHVREAINILSFCALMFDVLGALFALITSGTLLLRASEAKRFTTTKQKLCDEIAKALKTFTDFPEQHNTVQSPFDILHEKGQQYHRKAQELAHLMDDHLRGYMDVILVIVTGVVFFFASFILFIVNNQRLQVWVPTIVIVGVTTVMLLYMQSRRHPGIGRVVLQPWKAFLWYWGQDMENNV